jgi:bifunctional DNA-binding transcriptional regulator/antitoxin component of YhaV-PrlF toxin-antitoxin module
MQYVFIRSHDMSLTATITSKGQITISRAARMALKSNTVEVEIQGELVILRPVRSVAGALSGYVRGGEAFSAVRARVWREVADEKAGGAS